MKIHKHKKAMSATEQIMLLVVLVVVALILIWMSKTYLMDRGGTATENLISGVNDFDGDGVKNNLDRCRPAACDPGDRRDQIDMNPDSLYYGCLPSQGITLELYADTCNPRGTTIPTS